MPATTVQGFRRLGTGLGASGTPVCSPVAAGAEASATGVDTSTCSFASGGGGTSSVEGCDFGSGGATSSVVGCDRVAGPAGAGTSGADGCGGCQAISKSRVAGSLASREGQEMLLWLACPAPEPLPLIRRWVSTVGSSGSATAESAPARLGVACPVIGVSSSTSAETPENGLRLPAVIERKENCVSGISLSSPGERDVPLFPGSCEYKRQTCQKLPVPRRRLKRSQPGIDFTLPGGLSLRQRASCDREPQNLIRFLPVGPFERPHIEGDGFPLRLLVQQPCKLAPHERVAHQPLLPLLNCMQCVILASARRGGGKQHERIPVWFHQLQQPTRRHDMPELGDGYPGLRHILKDPIGAHPMEPDPFGKAQMFYLAHAHLDIRAPCDGVLGGPPHFPIRAEPHHPTRLADSIRQFEQVAPIPATCRQHLLAGAQVQQLIAHFFVALARCSDLAQVFNLRGKHGSHCCRCVLRPLIQTRIHQIRLHILPLLS